MAIFSAINNNRAMPVLQLFTGIVLALALIFMVLPGVHAEETEFTVDFSANLTEGTAPMPVQFTNEVIGNQVSGFWIIDETRYNQTAGPLHIFVEPGIYNVSLTITDDTNSTLTAFKQNYIVVHSSSPVQSISFRDHSIIGDHPVIITDKTTGTNVFIGTSNSKNVLLDQNGSFQVGIDPGGWKDMIAVPDFGLVNATTYARQNPIGIVFGAVIVGIFIARLRR